MKKRLRIHADTSVFGGIFDKEFRDVTLVLFSQIEKGLFELVTSEVVAEEVKSAPPRVQQIFTKYLPQTELLVASLEAIKLQQAFLSAKIVSMPYQTDALHVALATVAERSVLLSWNFKHVVHFQKIPLYNAINTLHGYAQLTINPEEVIFYE